MRATFTAGIERQPRKIESIHYVKKGDEIQEDEEHNCKIHYRS